MILSKLKTISSLRFFFSRASAKVSSFREPKIENQVDPEEVHHQETRQIDPAAVIKKFRRQVLTKSVFNKQEEQITKLIEEYDRDLRENLKKGTKDEQIAYSRKLIQKFVNEKSVFGNLTKDPLLSNYGNYAAYKAATLTQQRVRRDSWQGTEVEKGYKFLRNLGPEYIENQQIDEHLADKFQNQIPIEEYAKKIQRGVNDVRHLIYTAENHPRVATFKDFRKLRSRKLEGIGLKSDNKSEELSPIFSNEGVESITGFNGDNNFGRLSPIACEEIYRCYLDGWTVKDISQRFGIHPRRTKFIVWARATYYTEILPKFGFGHFKDVMLKEMQYGARAGFIDYGLDLGFMKEENEHFPKRITTWNNRMVDIKDYTDAERERKREQAIQDLEENWSVSKKSEKVILGYFGKYNKLSEMRNWTIFRSKGSDYQHTKYKTFRKLFKKTGRQTYK